MNFCLINIKSKHHIFVGILFNLPVKPYIQNSQPIKTNIVINYHATLNIKTLSDYKTRLFVLIDWEDHKDILLVRLKKKSPKQASQQIFHSRFIYHFTSQEVFLFLKIMSMQFGCLLFSTPKVHENLFHIKPNHYDSNYIISQFDCCCGNRFVVEVQLGVELNSLQC